MAQLGRAPGLGPGGRRFESCRSDHIIYLDLWRHSQVVRQRFAKPRFSSSTLGVASKKENQRLANIARLFLLDHQKKIPIYKYWVYGTMRP